MPAILKNAKTAFLTLTLMLIPLVAGAQSAQTSFEWSGFFAGGHAGWLWASIDYNEPNIPGFDIHPDFDGFQGGILAGYNRQIERFLALLIFRCARITIIKLTFVTTACRFEAEGAA